MRSWGRAWEVTEQRHDIQRRWRRFTFRFVRAHAVACGSVPSKYPGSQATHAHTHIPTDTLTDTDTRTLTPVRQHPVCPNPGPCQSRWPSLAVCWPSLTPPRPAATARLFTATSHVLLGSYGICVQRSPLPAHPVLGPLQEPLGSNTLATMAPSAASPTLEEAEGEHIIPFLFPLPSYQVLPTLTADPHPQPKRNRLSRRSTT